MLFLRTVVNAKSYAVFPLTAALRLDISDIVVSLLLFDLPFVSDTIYHSVKRT